MLYIVEIFRLVCPLILLTSFTVFVLFFLSVVRIKTILLDTFTLGCKYMRIIAVQGHL